MRRHLALPARSQTAAIPATEPEEAQRAEAGSCRAYIIPMPPRPPEQPPPRVPSRGGEALSERGRRIELLMAAARVVREKRLRAA